MKIYVISSDEKIWRVEAELRTHPTLGECYFDNDGLGWILRQQCVLTETEAREAMRRRAAMNLTAVRREETVLERRLHDKAWPPVEDY